MLRSAMALCVLAPLALAQAGREYVQADYGYRLDVPAAPWSVSEPPPPPGARHALKVSRVGAAGESSVMVYVLDKTALADGVAAATIAERRMAADAACTNVSRELACLRFDYGPLASRYSLRQRYCAHHGNLYVVQCAAPASRFEAELPALDAIDATFAFVPMADASAADRAALHGRLAARCGSELEWAGDWATARERATARLGLVVVLVERYRGVPVGRSMARSTAFSDRDVVELMGERFAVFEWKDPCGAPFEDPAIYGLGRSTFGQGILFVRPDGTVAGECVSFVPSALYHRACEVLAQEAGAAPAHSLDAAACLRRGELARGEELLRAPGTPEEWRLRATLLARLRRGEEALVALARADGEVAIPSAAILLRLGRHAEAEARLVAADAPVRAAPEARFLLAIARGMRLGIDPIKPELAALCEDHPDSPWAWRAAAMLVGSGILSGCDPIGWPDPAVLAAASPSAPEALAIAEVARAEREAIDYLLRTQSRSGTWPLPMISLAAPDSPAAVAGAAIGGTALLPYTARDEVRVSVERALAYVLTAPLAPSARMFDYAIWGQIFALRFLARCAAGGVGEPERVRRGMEHVVGRLRDGQQAGGGWAYIRYPGVADNSTGFVTAAAMRALAEAKAAGAVVDDRLCTAAARVLARLRRDSGVFGYMTLTGPGSDDAQAEAALRSPLYALALQAVDGGDANGIRRALDVYLAHRLHVRRERGKGLCHTGPEGHASYYLLYGYAFASEAVRALPAAERARYADALAEDVMHLRCSDGGFCDSAAMGRSYGAAQALIALAELSAGR